MVKKQRTWCDVCGKRLIALFTSYACPDDHTRLKFPPLTPKIKRMLEEKYG
jgi:hypothetical protein